MPKLAELTHSLSKWQILRKYDNLPIEAFLRALRRSKNIVGIEFDHFEADDVAKIIQDMPSLTCIRLLGTQLSPAVKDNPNLLYIDGDSFDSGSKSLAIVILCS